MKKKTEQITGEEVKEVAGQYDRRITGWDFATRLSATQRAVFNRLLSTQGQVGWQELRDDCWPRLTDGTIDSNIKAEHVRSAIAEIDKKAETFSKGRRCVVEIKLAPPNAWKAVFTFAKSEDVTGERPKFSWAKKTGKKQNGKNDATPEVHPRTFPVWVPVIAEGDDWLDVNILSSEPWQFPLRGFDYLKFREEKWNAFQEERSKDGLPPASNTPHWHVRSCIPRALGNERVRISFVVCRAEFKDYVATTRALDSEITYNNTKKMLGEHLRDAWNPREDNEHFPKAANPFAVDVNIITSDKKLVVRREVENGAWQPAIFGFVNALQDVHRGEISLPAPRETVFRKCCEYLGFNIVEGDVRWIGAAMQTKTGNVSIVGEIEVPYTSKQLEKFFDSRSDVSRSHELKFIEPTGDAIRELLGSESNGHRPRAEVAMVLTVARRDKSVKVEN